MPYSKPGCWVSALHCFAKEIHQQLSVIKLNEKSAFSSFLSPDQALFTAGKQIGVWNCHATRGHRKRTIFKSIVYYSHRSISAHCQTFFYSSVSSKTNDFCHWWMSWHERTAEARISAVTDGEPLFQVPILELLVHSNNKDPRKSGILLPRLILYQ